MSSAEAEFDRRVREVFAAAGRLAPGPRAEFLRAECGQEPELLAEVQSLLAAEEGPLPAEFPDRGAHESSGQRSRERLGTPPQPESKYGHPRPEYSGGMGTILFAWDRALCRRVAMKVARGEEERGDPDFVEPDERLVGRLMREALITGRLEHPAIVPVHELAVQTTGRVYFTMQCVRGASLDKQPISAPLEPAILTTRLRQLERVCQAVAYAHSRGVVHRDLKPGNVMVGEFDTVYVLDWGLAKVIDRGRFDAGVPHEEAASAEILLRDVDSDAHAPSAFDDDLSRSGVALGTPGYMAPEQARGIEAQVGYASDVYAAGAMLYELLCGARPHVRPGERAGGREVLARVLDGPPPDVRSLAPDAPPDLVAICERAMQQEPAARYASMLEMAQDLRRVLDGFAPTVAAPDAWRDMRYWLRRNRRLAAALALAAGIGTVGLAAYAHRSVRAAEDELHSRSQTALLALASARVADLPIDPAELPRYDQRLGELDAIRPTADAALAVFPPTASSAASVPAPLPDQFEVAAARVRLLGMLLDSIDAHRAAPPESRPTTFGARLALEPAWRSEWEYRSRVLSILAQGPDDRRVQLARASFELFAPGMGAYDRLAARRAAAASLAQRTLADPRWPECLASIADPARAPDYAGLRIRPQLGLVPLRQDPQSGLWEFLHVLSGAEPRRGADGRIEVSADDGIVLVLIPGRRIVLGLGDEGEPRSEQGRLEVALAPHFMGKYEVTQAQWFRMSGEWPSRYYAGRRFGAILPATLPVESVTWEASLKLLRLHGLALPTEAQWESVASDTLEQLAQLRSDEALRMARLNGGDAANAAWDAKHEPASVGDGFAFTAPVGSFPAEALGLHDLLGNVCEWCDGEFTNSYRTTAPTGSDPEVVLVEPGSGKLHSRIPGERVARGPTFATPGAKLSITRRANLSSHYLQDSLGLRAARRLEP